VNSPAAVIHEVESRDFDAVLMDLNYTRDTTSGQEGLDLLNRIQMLDTTLPVIVMTAWGQRRTGGGGHAPRGARFHPEAVGQRAALGDSEDADRAGARAAPGSGWKPRTAPCAPSASRN
jgi:CheY-like chemotaxis protein